MKKLILMSALVMGGLGITTADAQFGIRINLHLGTRPVYVPAPAPEPVVVDDQPQYNDDDFYYMPEVEAYYSVAENCYYYQDGDRWISAAFLPGRYHDFDWRYAKHYEVRAPRPYLHHDVYRGRFGGLPNRAAFYADANRGYDRRDDRGRGFDNQNRGGFDRHDDRGQNNNNRGGFDHNQGGNNQPQQNQGGYNQPAQNQNQGGQGRNQSGNNQPSQNQGGQQPSQGRGQQGGRGNGNSQPANHSNGQGNGNYNSGDHFAANKMGVVNDRGAFGSPARN